MITIALEAGAKILEVYGSEDFKVESKKDDSPLTLADQKSHETIVKGLEDLTPNLPILSEEGNHLKYEGRKDWDYFWLVDPLDGTKEFIKRNGEFTVNIALIHQGKPVLGVIYAPVLDTLYVAKEGLGSYKLEGVTSKQYNSVETFTTLAMKLPLDKKDEKISAVASRSHLSKETEEYLNKVKQKVGEIDITSAGSSLKLCLVAEGTADVYPRFAPTMEWDTAAGHAIVMNAGGTVTQPNTGEPLVYNKENLLNPWFIVRKDGFNL
ncbi:3'(2'),5'-bisphosphate nucleotidase CysQ [Pseudalkalibacillus hwajinpoensis]|uniref:3'(2'),5'-bisphosphate nucleotidase CysQ n=1 Tax=Guptibacillus hwajinpoensis TaxID=208199 RepID=A0A4U1MIF2_9BACL|nr:3'(2'),5'-bisphosphate nucleotidase CysQ [Pseudalkalibacillus hwajinpoensis]TKD70803.1 3'(2'),5'-bisphosphate nucleotidase CysQ [Pseudalkalibacillus hwajinpoensis]